MANATRTHQRKNSRRRDEQSRSTALVSLLAGGFALFGCAGAIPAPDNRAGLDDPNYRIGPLDTVEINVWQQQEFSTSVPVRPDGRISTPLIEDMTAAGRTPTELARDLEKRLKEYIKDPMVTVIVRNFNGPLNACLSG
ncbi:MAG: polysaccharide biosynthesis/export family protein [Rhodospirillaceae bacterium]